MKKHGKSKFLPCRSAPTCLRLSQLIEVIFFSFPKFVRAAPLQNEIALDSLRFQKEKWCQKMRKAPFKPPWTARFGTLDGRNRARVIAESLARVIAAIWITSVRWRSYLPLKTQNLVLVDPLRGPNWGLFLSWNSCVPGGFLQSFPKSVVTVKYYSNRKMARQWPLMAVNSR